MTRRLLSCALLALSACDDGRDYEFCALLPPAREVTPRVTGGEVEGELLIEWDGGPVHEVTVLNSRDRVLWGTYCDQEDEDGMWAPCVTSPVVFPIAEAQPALRSTDTYRARTTSWCALGGDQIQSRDRQRSFVAP